MNNQPLTCSVTAEQLMEQAQTYASTWASVGGPFDDGKTLERAEEEKEEFWRLVERLAFERDALAAHVERLKDILTVVTKWQNHVDPGERTAAIELLKESPLISLAHRDADTIASLSFPTMLRKMWSGGEVQQWINEQASEKSRQAEGGA